MSKETKPEMTPQSNKAYKMNREELRTRIITYCDYCGKELRPPYTTIKCKDGRELDFCSDYVEGERNCRQKFEEDGKTTSPPPAEGAEQRIRVRNILQDFYRRGEYELEQAEEDIMRLFQPQPTAEGAEEKKVQLRHLTDEEIEEHGKEGGLRDGELQMFWEGASWYRLYAQRIADKMVSERLREELIKLTKWYNSGYEEAKKPHLIVKEYLKSRDSHG